VKATNRVRRIRPLWACAHQGLIITYRGRANGVFPRAEPFGDAVMSAVSFEPFHAAISVLRGAGTGALGTLTAAGGPFASFVSVATDVDGTPLLLISRLAVHTANLARDPRCSLLLVAPGGEGGDPLAGARVTLEGTAERVTREAPELARLTRRFLARHPEAAGYAAFADFGVFRIAVERAHLVAGFGRIHTLAGADLIVPDGAADFVAAEAGIVEHLNEDHADTLRLYATRLLGQADGTWTAVAADPDGIDMENGGGVARLGFPKRQSAVMGVRYALKALADEARERF
jgi:putative heme iron utilization protein